MAYLPGSGQFAFFFHFRWFWEPFAKGNTTLHAAKFANLRAAINSKALTLAWIGVSWKLDFTLLNSYLSDFIYLWVEVQRTRA